MGSTSHCFISFTYRNENSLCLEWTNSKDTRQFIDNNNPLYCQMGQTQHGTLKVLTPTFEEDFTKSTWLKQYTFKEYIPQN